MTTERENTKSLSPERAEAVRRFVRARREALELNELAYAERVGVSQSQMNGFMNGRSSGGLMLIERIADREAVTVDEVLGRSVPNPAIRDSSEAGRASAAARALSFSEAAIAAGLADARPSDDAWSILGLIERAHRAAQRTTSIQPFGPPETDKPPQGHTANNARLEAAKKKRGER